LLHAGKIEGCSLSQFQDATGLDLCDQDGSLREDLPPITQFLNRVLALRIGLQNTLFAAFEQLLEARVETAVAGGTYDVGVETLIAEGFTVAERRTVCAYAATGAETRCYKVLQKNRNRPLSLAEALALLATPDRLLINKQSYRAAVQIHASSLMHYDGRVEARTRLIRPMARETVSVEQFEHSHWRPATVEEFAPL
jgi:C-terminal domain on Strawberry notch homologue